MVLSSANLSPSECLIYAFLCRQVITFLWNVLFYSTPPKFLCHFHHCAIITYSINNWGKQDLLFLFPCLCPEKVCLITFLKVSIRKKKKKAATWSNKSQGLETLFLLWGIKHNSLVKFGLPFISSLLASFTQYFYPFVSIIHFALSSGVFYNLTPLPFFPFHLI